MNKKTTISLVIGTLFLFLLSSIGYAQGDNTQDPLVNLGCLESATLSGSMPEGVGRGIPSDILWDPSTNDFMTPSTYHEYGLGYDSTAGGITRDNPMYWQVEWPTAKNINYITVTGPYDNQPQPHTGWAIQIWADSISSWVDLPKAHNGWEDDSLRGIGGWVNDGLLEWKGLEPVVTKKLRFIAFANPDSLADGVETFADSLWSMVFTARQMSPHSPKACLIQYLDYTGAEADNEMDEMVNLGLIDEAVVSASFVAGEIDNIRGAPTELLFDPVKGDFHYTGTPWGEFGYPWEYDAGYVEYENPFYWMVEWATPKNINFFTWGGVYGNQPQPTTPWAVEYWDGTDWVEVLSGVGGSFEEGDALYPYTPGVDTDAQSIWMSETPIQTTKFRLAVWSDGIDPLFSYHIRGRGGLCMGWDETDSTFKAILLQYKDLDVTAIEPNDVEEPTKFALNQNYPNPFNPTTKIGYLLEQQGHVRLSVYNLLGQEVAVLVDEVRNCGLNSITFDASSLSSGLYFYKLQVNQKTLTKKMLLLK